MFGKSPPPWGTNKFQPAHTYAPNFHQPRNLKHIDTNSRLDINWEKAMKRARSKAAAAARVQADNPETTTTTSQPSVVTMETKSVTMVSEMQDTLNKINTLLADLQTRRTTKPSTTTTATDNTTITSCLDSISRDISSLSSQIPPTRKPEPSTDSAVTMATSLPHDEQDETDDAPKQSTDKRTRKATGKSTTSSSNFYRGSDASQAYSLHRSSFNSIAALSGFGEVTTLRQRRNSVATDTGVATETSGAQYFTEYPPQRGSKRFNGVFADDIQALLN
eukprot:sb/3467999/